MFTTEQSTTTTIKHALLQSDHESLEDMMGDRAPNTVMTCSHSSRDPASNPETGSHPCVAIVMRASATRTPATLI